MSNSDKRKHERKGSFFMTEVAWLLKSKQSRSISNGAKGLLWTLWGLCKDSEPATTELGYDSHKQMLHHLCGFNPSLDPDEIDSQLNELLAQNLVSYNDELRNVLHVRGFRRVHAALNWSGKKGRKPKERDAAEASSEADCSDDDDDRQQFGNNSATIRRELPNNSANIRGSRERVEKSKEEKKTASYPKGSSPSDGGIELPLSSSGIEKPRDNSPAAKVGEVVPTLSKGDENQEGQELKTKGQTDPEYLRDLAASYESRNGVGAKLRECAIKRRYQFKSQDHLAYVLNTPQMRLLTAVLYVERNRKSMDSPEGVLYHYCHEGAFPDPINEALHRDVKFMLALPDGAAE